jgi:hypothetical protein
VLAALSWRDLDAVTEHVLMSTPENSTPSAGREFALKVTALVIATITAIFGLAQHYQGIRQDHEIKEREIQANLDLRRDEIELKKTEVNQPFWSRRADFCLLAVGAASRIAVQQGKDAKALEDFWTLYWGPLAAVSGRGDPERVSLEEAVVRYGDVLYACTLRPNEECWEQLRICSLDLAQECTAMLCEGVHEKTNVDACIAAAAPRKLACPPSTRPATH